MSLLGCCAVLEPRNLRIAYIDIDNTESVQADQILERTRAALHQMRGKTMEPSTIHPSPHVEPGEQAVLGTLTATLVEIALTYNDHPSVKAVALAIYKLRPKTAFIVKATREEHGTATAFIDVDCEDPAKAKQAIEDRTEVRMLRDFQQMAEVTKVSPKLG